MRRPPCWIQVLTDVLIACVCLACSGRSSSGEHRDSGLAGCEDPAGWLDSVILELGQVAYDYFVLEGADDEMRRGLKPESLEDASHDSYRQRVLSVLRERVVVPEGFWEVDPGNEILGYVLSDLRTLIDWQNWKITEVHAGGRKPTGAREYLITWKPFMLYEEQYLVRVSAAEGQCRITGVEALKGRIALRRGVREGEDGTSESLLPR